MARAETIYRCQECGYQTTNWMGRCSSCGNWNTFIKYNKNSEKAASASSDTAGDSPPAEALSEDIKKRARPPRFNTAMAEFDRVLGGGIVAGSLVLLGGAPGVGKSTLILQVSHMLAEEELRCLYIAGEESADQLALRAERLGVFHSRIKILSATSWQKISSHLQKEEYDFVVVDSIQTVYDSSYQSSPGSVTQVRELTSSFQQLARKQNIPVFLIGHVTKEGQLAGPKVMEHMVDTVLYFQESSNFYRLLKAHKNRFGATDEVGVFAMGDSGLREIKNPSSLFLEGRPENCSGSAVVPVLEGSRTILVELQALVSSKGYGHPRRITSGLNRDRADLLLAVLDKRLGLELAERDVHFNVVGGLQLDEPALDLALAASVISSYLDIALPPDLAAFGEVGLSGEVRAVSRSDRRAIEARKMGFNGLLLPASSRLEDFNPGREMEIIEIDRITGLFGYIRTLAEES